MAKRTEKAPTLMVLIQSGLETNTLVSGKMANRTDKAPTPLPVARNTLVSSRVANGTDKAATPSAGGDKYVGELQRWLNGADKAPSLLPSGSKYVGEWSGGKRNGQGTYTFADGDTLRW